MKRGYFTTINANESLDFSSDSLHVFYLFQNDDR